MTATSDNNSTLIGELTESDCVERLAPLWNVADVHQEYPTDTATVVDVLRNGGGYDVTAELIESWARSQAVGRVPIRGGKFSWTPSAMLACCALANSSRRWLMHAAHIPKMTAVELAELQARQLGESVFRDLDECDPQTLIGIISNTNDAERRSALCVGLVALLRHKGIIR